MRSYWTHNFTTYLFNLLRIFLSLNPCTLSQKYTSWVYIYCRCMTKTHFELCLFRIFTALKASTLCFKRYSFSNSSSLILTPWSPWKLMFYSPLLFPAASATSMLVQYMLTTEMRVTRSCSGPRVVLWGCTARTAGACPTETSTPSVLWLQRVVQYATFRITC